MIKDSVDALREECLVLDRLLSSPRLGGIWEQRTAFFDWTIRDEVMHLHLVDRFAVQSLEDREAFRATVVEVRAAQAKGVELSAQMRSLLGHHPPMAMLSIWRATWNSLCERASADDAKRRVPWFGPDMSVRSLINARQMEVWAHGQDIFDVLRMRRVNNDSIRYICELGVKTFDWSFRNRGEVPPGEPPTVVLKGPSGSEWVWNHGAHQSVTGSAEEFAMVVTQRRNVEDTHLQVDGPVAQRWMKIAQCFAGSPESPPAPGVRVVATDE
jgi:uncharacterized protein (TIGR03084 family)